jgi:hypothetical protein
MHEPLSRFSAMALISASLGGCGIDTVDYFQPSAPSGDLGSLERCSPVPHGVYFSAEIGNHERRITEAIFAFGSAYSSATIRLVADKGHKNFYDTSDPDWTNDRTRPYMFSSNKIDVTWQNGGHQTFIIPMLTSRGDHFESLGRQGSPGWAFEEEFALTDFTGNWFVVQLPSFSFDGATINPTPVRFERKRETVITAINC